MLPDFGAAAAGLPPTSEARRRNNIYYKLQFMEDGYPGKLTVDGVYAHPILGTYQIGDYLSQYRETEDEKFLAGAEKIAEAALKRMEYREDYDALIFYYKNEGVGKGYDEEFMSGLTQARYVLPFYQLYIASKNEKYATATQQVFNSLLIPKADGGPKIETSFGVAVEEFPFEIPTYVLNGWTTLIVQLLRYHEVSGDEKALEFAKANIATIENILDRYDYPSIFNSRYCLTGNARVKFVFQKPNNGKLDQMEILVGEKFYGLTEDGSDFWHNFIIKETCDKEGFAIDHELQAQGIFSQINDRQEMKAELTCKQPDIVKVYVSSGHYHPDRGHMTNDYWILMDEFDLKEGDNHIELAMDNRNFEMIGYPTSFKSLDDKKHNVYHWLHIRNFEVISRYVDSPKFDKMRKKWIEYVDMWPKLPYFDEQYSFERP